MNKHTLPARRSGVVSDEAASAIATPRYWAFISYSHADSAAAERLHKQLETYRTPRILVGANHPFGMIPAKLTPIFRDRQELAASSDLGREIKEAIADSRYLIVICSPAAAASRWVDQEIRDFKRLHGEDRVLAAIVSGEPFAADPKDECFPPSLRQQVDKRGKPTGKPAEPIAADLRDSGDGWKLGTLKIIAGLFDVGLDDLVQRDQQRRQKRMTWIAAASLAGMAFTSGMSVVAINARDAARDERRAAEGLVGFMLGDLKDELEPIGRLSALDQVGARALAYYERQDKKKLTDDQLAQRSRALTLLGQIATSRADSTSAETRYREAFRSTEELVLRAPDNPQRLFDHAQNVFYLGEMARSQGQLRKAENAYREYQRLADRMVEIEPLNPRWRMEKVYATENIGIALWNRRRFSEAASQFESTVGPMSVMASENPDNPEYQREFSNLLAWLADARRDEGREDDAIALRERQIAFLSEKLAMGETNVSLREHLVPAQQALGILLTSQGRSAGGIERLRSAVMTSDNLIPIEPDNAIWKSYAVSARLELARSLLSLGRASLAATETNAACSMNDELRALDKKSASWRSAQTICLANRSNLALAAGSTHDALTLAGQALESAKNEHSVDPIKDRYSIADAYRLIGDVRRRLGEIEAARAAWNAGLQQLPPKVPERPLEMRVRAELLERLGKLDEARLIRKQLTNIGIRKIGS